MNVVTRLKQEKTMLNQPIKKSSNTRCHIKQSIGEVLYIGQARIELREYSRGKACFSIEAPADISIQSEKVFLQQTTTRSL